MLRKDKKQYADQEKNRELEQHNEPAGNQRAAAIALAPRGEEALDNGLIRAVRRHGEKRATDHPGPKGVFASKVPREVQELQFVSVERGDLSDFAPAAWNAVQQDSQGQNAAGKIKQKLRDVGPDDRFHASFEGVQYGQRDHDKHGKPLRCSERNAHDQGDCGDSHAFGKSAGGQKRNCRNGAHSGTEAFFDQGVGGQVFSTKIPGQKENGNEHTAYDVAKDQLQKCEIAGIRDGGSADDCERGCLGGHD